MDRPPADYFRQLIQRSDAVPYAFPIERNRLKNVCVSEQMQREAAAHATGTRPVLHARALPLLKAFLEHKAHSTHASKLERSFYAEMKVSDLITRLLSKRPLVFYTSGDVYMMKDGASGAGGFEAVGTEAEAEPLLLQRTLSYDEMALSAMIAMSVPTHFINAGSRGNCGSAGGGDPFVPRGVYIGQVGARFERRGVMDWATHIVASRPMAGRTRDEAYLNAWAKFYGIDAFPQYEEARAEYEASLAASAPCRYVVLKRGFSPDPIFFDTRVFRARCRIIAETFLCEANARASAERTPIKAACHVVGVGLGVWQVDTSQAQIYVDAFADAIASCKLEHVDVVYFSWINASRCGAAGDGGSLLCSAGTRVAIRFGRRDPAADDDVASGRLLVAQYAWDSGSYPGNEYWHGMLSASGDPAACACSTIGELQNPDINVEAMRGENLRIVCTSAK